MHHTGSEVQREGAHDEVFKSDLKRKKLLGGVAVFQKNQDGVNQIDYSILLGLDY